MSYFNLANIASPTIVVTATTSTTAFALPLQAGEFLEITNLGANPVWVTTGIATVTAVVPTTSGQNNKCISAGSIQTVRPSQNTDTFLAAITTGGSTLLSISVTTGI